MKSIIVRMPNWIGDLVMATPILQDLRAYFPEASITAMCRAPLGELLESDPNIDELFNFSKARGASRHDERRSVVGKLRAGKFDLGVVLPNSFSSAWLFWQGRVKKRLGFTGHFRRFLLTDAMEYPENRKTQHLVLTYKKLLEPLGIIDTKSVPKLFVEEAEIDHAWALLERYGIARGSRLVGINPGAAYGSAKCWLPERFREVTMRLLEAKSDATILFFGAGDHTDLCKEICQGLPPRVVNLAGLTNLREMMALIKILDAFLTNDSGPMHVAAALETPLVALFGSTDDVVTGPFDTGKVIHKRVSCSPCFKRTCPIDFRCMKQIGSDEVLSEILALLS